MSFTEKQKTIIVETWQSMQANRNAWPDLLIRLFAEHAEYQKLFKPFASVPFDQLRDNKCLAKQVSDVIAMISDCIGCMDDENALVKMMKGMAARHYHRKITIQMFEDLGIAFISWLVGSLGTETMNDEAIAVWRQLYTTMVSIIKNYYLEFENANTNS